MTVTTLIRNADWIVAYDAKTDGHTYLRHADVAFSGDAIVHVGKDFRGEAERVIDGRDLMVLPGTLDLHLHAYMEMHGKGFFEDLATKHMWMTQLFEYTWLLQEDEESLIASTQASACDLLKSGCTTMAELFCSGLPYGGWVEMLGATGIRTYVCPMVQSGHWYTPNGRDHLYEWYEEKGFENLEVALGLIDAAIAHPSRTPARDGGGGPGRHLHRGDVRPVPGGGREAGHPAPDPRRPVRHGAPGDGAAPWQDAHRVARGDRRPRAQTPSSGTPSTSTSTRGSTTTSTGTSSASPTPARPSCTARARSRSGAT